MDSVPILIAIIFSACVCACGRGQLSVYIWYSVMLPGWPKQWHFLRCLVNVWHVTCTADIVEDFATQSSQKSMNIRISEYEIPWSLVLCRWKPNSQLTLHSSGFTCNVQISPVLSTVIELQIDSTCWFYMGMMTMMSVIHSAHQVLHRQSDLVLIPDWKH